MPITRVTSLKREETRLRGERGQLISTIAQAKGRISETALQILQIDQDLRSEVSKELREVQAKIAELVERKVAAEDQLKRIDIRAPQDGIVHQSIVHTVGGVINAGEPLMLVVPEADELSIEVKVSPQDIDQLRPGLDTVLRLSAFNQRTTPELKGKVSLIAADLVTDQRSGVQYYPGARGLRGGRAGAARRPEARAGHARRGADPDRIPHGVLLPDEAGRGQHGQGLPRGVRSRSKQISRKATVAEGPPCGRLG